MVYCSREFRTLVITTPHLDPASRITCTLVHSEMLEWGRIGQTTLPRRDCNAIVIWCNCASRGLRQRYPGQHCFQYDTATNALNAPISHIISLWKKRPIINKSLTSLLSHIFVWRSPQSFFRCDFNFNFFTWNLTIPAVRPLTNAFSLEYLQLFASSSWANSACSLFSACSSRVNLSPTPPGLSPPSDRSKVSPIGAALHGHWSGWMIVMTVRHATLLILLLSLAG